MTLEETVPYYIRSYAVKTLKISFNEDRDCLVVVKKSEGEKTVVIKLKNVDKE